MKIVELNSMNFGSTGKIMLGIAEVARIEGDEVWTYNPDGRTQKKGILENYTIGSRYERFISAKINYFTGKQGALNLIGTYKFLSKLEQIKPDIIHFHNLHSNYINFALLFKYINKNNIKVVWTLHDCWAFTGQCPYFDIVQCEKWISGCYSCPMIHQYPATKWDNSRREYSRKKKIFTSVKNMLIVTPSQWLADLTRDSFLNKYPVEVIYNGINLSIFQPRFSDFRNKYRIENKFIILGVAFSWGIRKGQDRFEKLAEKLDERFQIVLVGINGKDVKSDKIICITKTDNQQQLAEIYTAADVLLNPTREDNFPTVNIEALACGTPVLSYGAGGSAEAFDKKSGTIVSDDTVVETLKKLYKENLKKENCIIRAKQFDQNKKFKEYVDLYRTL